MPVKKRALFIGLMGPAIQAVGFLWQAAHFYVYHLHDSLTVRHLVFEPGVLMVIVGFLVGIVCIPLATEVAASSEGELEIPGFGAGEEAVQAGLRLPPGGAAS